MAKTVRMKFKSGEGKKFSISMSHASPALLEEGGEEIAQAAIDELIARQPLNRVIAECTGVEVVDRTVVSIL